MLYPLNKLNGNQLNEITSKRVKLCLKKIKFNVSPWIDGVDLGTTPYTQIYYSAIFIGLIHELVI